MSNRTTKVRTGDWRSIEKAINQLGTSRLGPNASPTYKTINITSDVTMSGSQLKDFALEKVADAAARLALTWYPARVVYQEDEGCAYLATTL